MLQLYLHQLIKKNLKGQFSLSYNNMIDAKDIREGYKYTTGKKASIADALQLLTIAYNIGHFRNTFTSSRAITLLASKDQMVYDMVINASADERYQNAARKILDEKDYQKYHLLNSILILERCDQSKQAISLTLELLYAFLNKGAITEEHILKNVFDLFYKVRKVSYMAYDLQIAETPLLIDLCDEKGLLVLLREYLSDYNDNRPLNQLVFSIAKLLDDTVYNENSNAICYYLISRKIARRIQAEMKEREFDYYTDYFSKLDSTLNNNYPQRRDYEKTQILKLTFSKERRDISEALLSEFERIWFIQGGYYNRESNEQTVLASVKVGCSIEKKRLSSFKVMRSVINRLRQIPGTETTDKKYLLSVKFFLFYLFNENPVLIKPTVHQEKCVICTRGRVARMTEVKNLLKNSCGDEDQNHEVEFLMSRLSEDSVNDTSIVIPASIVVYQKDGDGSKYCEFDGMIIHPNREKKQITFLEAKNKNHKPSEGKNCLKEKLEKLSIGYSVDEIQIDKCDAYLPYSIQ